MGVPIQSHIAAIPSCRHFQCKGIAPHAIQMSMGKENVRRTGMDNQTVFYIFHIPVVIATDIVNMQLRKYTPDVINVCCQISQM